MTNRSEFYQALGRTIHVVRTDRGLDRRQLAELVGISYSYMAAIENGQKRPSSPVLMTIADRLGLQSHELLEAAERRHSGRQLPGPAAAPPELASELAALAAGLEASDLELLVALARRLSSGATTDSR